MFSAYVILKTAHRNENVVGTIQWCENRRKKHARFHKSNGVRHNRFYIYCHLTRGRRKNKVVEKDTVETKLLSQTR